MEQIHALYFYPGITDYLYTMKNINTVNEKGSTKISIVDNNGTVFVIAEDPNAKLLELFFGKESHPMNISFSVLKEMGTRLHAFLIKNKSPRLVLSDINGSAFEMNKSKVSGNIEFVVYNDYTLSIDKEIGNILLNIINRYLSVGFLPKDL